MKSLVTLLLAYGSLAFQFCICGQGTFQNLDFEEADVSGDHVNSLVATSSAFPFWQAFYDTTPATEVWYDSISTGAPLISIVDGQAGPVIQGNYSAYLFSASSTVTTLSQTGLVPVGAQSIQMEASEYFGSFFVLLGGQAVNMVAIQSFPNYTLYGGNISAWAGQFATLSITEGLPTGLPHQSPSYLELDNITFSPNAVTATPEPSTVALTALEGLLFALYRRLVPMRLHAKA
ncbi:MAG: hypothetical protein ACLQVY_29375 [Limisphaerales bacterium]